MSQKLFSTLLGIGIAGALIFTTGSEAFATNGMNAIASSARAAGMGGVDLGIGGDHSAMNTNPAGITQFDQQFGVTINLLVPTLTATDQVTMQGPDGSPMTMPINSDAPNAMAPMNESETALFPLFGVGFTRRVSENLYAGLGFYVQGGMGAEFNDFATMTDPDPTTPGNPMSESTPGTYDTSSTISYMKFTPTIAYAVDLGETRLSAGLALNIGLAQMGFHHSGMQFPETDGDFMYYAHDVEYNSNTALGGAGRIGFLAELMNGFISVGGSYQSETHITFAGKTELDNTYDYNDASMEFVWPQELGGGLALRPIEGLLIGADVRWINWSSAMDTITLVNDAESGAIPDDGSVPTHFEMPFQMNWEDQIVLAFGAQYQPIELLTFRAGVNHGASPVGPNGVNTLFPAVTELHTTFGLGITPLENLSLDAAIEYVAGNTVTSNNENQMAFSPANPPDPTNADAAPPQPTPNGYQTEVMMEQTSFHMSVNYLF